MKGLVIGAGSTVTRGPYAQPYTYTRERAASVYMYPVTEMGSDTYPAERDVAAPRTVTAVCSQRADIVAHSKHTATTEWLAQAFDHLSMPLKQEDIAVSFDPDDYPLM